MSPARRQRLRRTECYLYALAAVLLAVAFGLAFTWTATATALVLFKSACVVGAVAGCLSLHEANWQEARWGR